LSQNETKVENQTSQNETFDIYQEIGVTFRWKHLKGKVFKV